MAIYLDSNATTRTHPAVIEGMLPYMTESWHNPSSHYRSGRIAREAVEIAREQVANLIGAQPSEVVFTGSGTESNNTALKSLAHEIGCAHSKIVVSEIEHSAVLRPAKVMEEMGFDLAMVGVDAGGCLDLGALDEAISDSRPGFVSVMWANNETGVMQPIDEVVQLAEAAGWYVHSDAAAAVGKVPVRVDETAVDFLSLSGHKFHSVKGIGALYIRSESPFEPMIRGAGQESGRRSGTENVASIVGMGIAAELASQALAAGEMDRVGRLRDRFEQELQAGLNGSARRVRCNGIPEKRTPNVAHISFVGCEASDLITALDDAGVQCSAGSACMTGDGQKVSHVQQAMGISEEDARAGLRFSLSQFTTDEEIDEAVARIIEIVAVAPRVNRFAS